MLEPHTKQQLNVGKQQKRKTQTNTYTHTPIKYKYGEKLKTQKINKQNKNGIGESVREIWNTPRNSECLVK